jgi:hypothetical protein
VLAALTTYFAVLVAPANVSTVEAIIGEPTAVVSADIIAAAPSHAMTSSSRRKMSGNHTGFEGRGRQRSAKRYLEPSWLLLVRLLPIRSFINEQRRRISNVEE